ncbi:MAG: response regulator [Eubacteriales bacterium]|nr:response regulator [Eubacteriales bacterium]
MQIKKYKVLAADDEYWSRENIRNLLPWEEYSIEFLEPACDGEEVMERIPEEHPDIILTDINMPFLSGLEMLERLNAEYPEIITVAVSGYDDFEKVKGVFISGGIDYLLKPVGKEELVNVLTKALGILEEREAAKEHNENRRLQEHKISSFLEDSEYSALLSEKLYGQVKTQPHVSSTQTFSEVATVLVKFYDITEIAARFDHDILQMSWSIKSTLRELFGKGSNAVIFNYSSKMSEFLLVGTAEAGMLKRFAEQVLERFPAEDYGPVSVVLHEQTSSLDDIAAVYREIITVLVTRQFRREHCILRCPETGKADSSSTIGKYGSARLEGELYHLLATRQKTEAEKLIFKTSDFASCDKNGWSYLEVKQYVGRITGTLFRYVRDERPEMIVQIEEAMDSIDYYMKCLDAKAMIMTMNIILDSLWEKNEQSNTDSVIRQVEQVQQYISRHYFENITLTSLAAEYHIDASYLSRVFSQKYGETIITFLTRVRMEHAVELMRDPDKKLETISFLVGYDDYNYFSRVFRKKLGVSPSEYRSHMLKKQ